MQCGSRSVLCSRAVLLPAQGGGACSALTLMACPAVGFPYCRENIMAIAACVLTLVVPLPLHFPRKMSNSRSAGARAPVLSRRSTTGVFQNGSLQTACQRRVEAGL